MPRFDSVDRIEDRNSLTYGFDNFFNVYTSSDPNIDDIRQAASLKIEQVFDLRDEASDEPFGPIFAKLIWNPIAWTSLNYKTFYDVYEGDFNTHSFSGEYGNSRGDRVGLEYSFNEEQDIEQLNARARAQIWNRWYAGGEVQHSIAHDETNKATGSLIYQALCWSVQFETRYTPIDTTYLVVFSLANIGAPFGVSL